MTSIYIIKPKVISTLLSNMLKEFTKVTEATEYIYVEPSLIPDLSHKKIIFALELDNIGYCPEVFEIISHLYTLGKDALIGSTGVLLIHSNSDLYTKSASGNLIFLANQLGCTFVGHPLIEATNNLNNFQTWKKTLDLPLEEICLEQCKKLQKRFYEDSNIKFSKPKLLALHASSRTTSNTLMLWNMIKANLSEVQIEDLNVENGTIHDCIGCSFTTCIHFSKQNSCFYGGIMVSEIIPAIEKADAVVFICPNYNDAVSANLTAVINRTTALYRKMSFHEKYFFSVIVSGNSGSDSIAKQLIGALNINKGFKLPPYSMIMETANDPGSINNVISIENKAHLFATNLIKSIKK